MCEVEPDLEYFISYTPPIPRSDLDAIQRTMSRVDPFVPGAVLEDPYDVVTYLPRQMLHREKYILLVDRNVVTRWVGTASGQDPTPAHRQAAAIMAFAHAADFSIEPNISLYELAAQVPVAEALHELSLFYESVNAPTLDWADVALGRSDNLSIEKADEVDETKPKPDLKRSLYRWRRNYVLALKLAELHLKGGKPLPLMAELMRWMYEDFVIGGPALQLASFYLAPGAPRRRLLKGIQSLDRGRALAGIRNTAWDLTLISEWLSLVTSSNQSATSNRVHVLCTMDRSVQRLARSIVSFDESIPENEAIFRLFEPLWGEQAARHIASLLHNYQSNADNAEREFHKQRPDDFLDILIADGESLIRSWVPSGGGA